MGRRGAGREQVLTGLELAILTDIARLDYSTRDYYGHAARVGEGKPLSSHTVRAHLRRVSVALGTEGAFAAVIAAVEEKQLIPLDSILAERADDVSEWLKGIDDRKKGMLLHLYAKAAGERSVKDTPRVRFVNNYAPGFVYNMPQLATIVCALAGKGRLRRPEMVQRSSVVALTPQQLNLLAASLSMDYAEPNVISYLAAKFSLSPNTVNAQLMDAHRRLGVHDLFSAVAVGLFGGILPLEGRFGSEKMSGLTNKVSRLHDDDKAVLAGFYGLALSGGYISPPTLKMRAWRVTKMTGAQTPAQLALVAHVLVNELGYRSGRSSGSAQYLPAPAAVA